MQSIPAIPAVTNLRTFLGVTSIDADPQAQKLNAALRDVYTHGPEAIYDTTRAVLDMPSSGKNLPQSLHRVADIATDVLPGQLSDMLLAAQDLPTAHPMRRRAISFLQNNYPFEQPETRFTDRPSVMGREVVCMTEVETSDDGIDELSPATQMGRVDKARLEAALY